MPRVALNVAILRVNIKVPGESFTGAQRLAFLAGNKAQEKREKKESRKEEKKRIKREGERGGRRRGGGRRRTCFYGVAGRRTSRP